MRFPRARTNVALAIAAAFTLATCSTPPTAHAVSAGSERFAQPPERVVRVGAVQWLRKHREEEEQIVPPVYSNHMPKSLAFETLVRCDARGVLQPGLALRWESSPDAMRHTFHLRPDVRFHDGTPCDAAAVKAYFESWLVRPQDRFIAGCERITRVEAPDATTVVFVMREPYSLLPDLPLMNPMGIVGGRPAAEGEPYPMNGTGPWRVAEFASMERALYRRNERYDGRRPRLDAFEWKVLVAGADRDPVSTWALERGRVDLVVESWRPSIPRDIAKELADERRCRIVRAPGGMVQTLCFNHGRAPFAHVAWRRAVRDAVDRGALIERVESGFARACTTLFPPELADWPDEPSPAARITSPRPTSPEPAGRVRAQFVANGANPEHLRAAHALREQLAPIGIEVEVVELTPNEYGRRVAAGEFDLYLGRTWGAPYDPHSTLVARFGNKPPGTASPSPAFFDSPELDALVRSTFPLPPGEARAPIYARVQELFDREVAVLPLYIPDRIALLGPHVDGVTLAGSIYEIDLTDLRWVGSDDTPR